MSQAFVRESDGQWLEDVGPSKNALMVFLTRENNGLPVTERSSHLDTNGRQVLAMSNGMSYAKDSLGKWQLVQVP